MKEDDLITMEPLATLPHEPFNLPADEKVRSQPTPPGRVLYGMRVFIRHATRAFQRSVPELLIPNRAKRGWSIESFDVIPQIECWFDPRVLANYLVSSKTFVHPLNRRGLTRQECETLDAHLGEHPFPQPPLIHHLLFTTLMESVPSSISRPTAHSPQTASTFPQPPFLHHLLFTTPMEPVPCSISRPTAH